MPSANCRFRRNEVKRAIECVASAGLPIGGVQFRPDGLIVVYTEKHQAAFPPEVPADRRLGGRGKQPRAAQTQPAAATP